VHSPEVMVFDLNVPLPSVRWKSQRTRWDVSRRHYTCPEGEHPLCGKPMYAWWRPTAWELTLAGRRMGWLHVADVWHYEPEEADSGTVCKGMGSSELTWANVRWAWSHRDHVEIHWTHYRRWHRWLFLRCDHCGKPFRGDYRAVTGTMGGEERWHTHCSSILDLRRTNEVLADYIVTGNDEWIAQQWAKGIVARKHAKEAVT
jgi:hypothetical protein